MMMTQHLQVKMATCCIPPAGWLRLVPPSRSFFCSQRGQIGRYKHNQSFCKNQIDLPNRINPWDQIHQAGWEILSETELLGFLKEWSCEFIGGNKQSAIHFSVTVRPFPLIVSVCLNTECSCYLFLVFILLICVWAAVCSWTLEPFSD